MIPATLQEDRYYKIREVAKGFEVRESLIRYWEKEFEILEPQRMDNNTRLFTQSDIRNIALIYDLVKERGFTLEGAKVELKKNINQHQNKMTIKQELIAIKNSLMAIREYL